MTLKGNYAELMMIIKKSGVSNEMLLRTISTVLVKFQFFSRKYKITNS